MGEIPLGVPWNPYQLVHWILSNDPQVGTFFPPQMTWFLANFIATPRRRSPLNHMVALGSGNPQNALNNSGLGIIGETLPRMIETVFGVGVAHPNPHACAWDIPRCTTQKKLPDIFQFKTHLPQKHHWEDHDDLVAVAMHQKMPWSWQNWEPCIEKELFRVAVQHKKGFTHRLHSQKNERIAAWKYRIPKLGNYS